MWKSVYYENNPCVECNDKRAKVYFSDPHSEELPYMEVEKTGLCNSCATVKVLNLLNVKANKSSGGLVLSIGG